jgi:tetratricopeptide (TPR) repeat protein
MKNARLLMACATALLLAAPYARADDRLDAAEKKLHDGDAAGARADLEALARERPDDALVQYDLGSAYVLSKDFAKAKKAFEKCVKLSPDHIEARRVLASLLAREGKDEAAARVLEPAVEKSPDDQKLRTECATAWAKAAQAARASASRCRECADRAIAHYRKLLEGAPDFEPALYNVGLMQVLTERWADAESSLARAVEQNPDDLAALYNLAVAREHAAPERAVETWETFIEKAKKSPQFKRDVPYAESRVKALRAKK